MTHDHTSGLTIVALAWNETEHLRACFASLKTLVDLTGAETLVLFDSAGDDATLKVAHEVADRVVIADFDNFAAQRNRALDLANSRWVFFIDPDERCTPRLAQEIAQVINGGDCAAYRVPRRNFLFGHEVRHTGWSPDYQIRLLEREHCRYDESRRVHELPTVDGEIGTLKAKLVHYNYDTWGQFIAKQRAYSDLEAQALYESGRRASLKSIVGQPLRELKRRLIDYQGYRDGLLGISLSVAMALHVAQTFVKLRCLHKQS
ncbi:MAG TPA: glycosyltransferase family 2 protein [Chloroflexia bacterium]|nr:glycosyltransferase family 2 protein [Chloroflexia bacterium]